MAEDLGMRDGEGHPAMSGRRANTDGGPAEHVVQFYREDGFLLDAVARFVIAGVHDGDSVIVVATADHLAVLERALSAADIPLAELSMRGRLRLCDARETLARLMTGDAIDPNRFAELVPPMIEEARKASASGGVRAFGEMVNILWSAGNEAAVMRLEELWQEIVASEHVPLLCGYDMGSLGGAAAEHLIDVASRNHTHARLPQPLGDHLQRVTEQLVRAVTARDIACIGLDTVNDFLGMHAGSVSLVRSPEAARDDGTPSGDWELEAQVIAELRRMPPSAHLAAAEAMRTKRPAFAESGPHSAPERASLVSIPMVVGGVVLGSMNFGFATLRRLSSEERDFMQAVVDQCALALERTRLFDAERRARNQLEARQAEMAILYRLMEAVTRAERFEDVLGPALDAVTAGLKVGRAAVLLYDDDGVMRFKAWRSLSEGYRKKAEGHSPWARDEQEPAPLLVADVEADEAWRASLPIFRQERIRALGFIPLTHQRQLLGKFMVYSERPRLFTRQEIELAQTVAAQVSQALARTRLLRSERALALERAQLLEREQRAVRARDDLIAMVSHDLRNFAGVIAVNAAVIARGASKGTVPDGRRKEAEIIGRSVGRMERLIRDLLDVGSIEAGQLKVDRQPEDISVLLSQTLDDLQPLAVSRALRLRVQIPPVPLMVSCDRQRVFQVLSNLVGNALKFTPAGGSIAVSCERRDREVLLAVSDTGPGIAAEQAARIFERYYQAGLSERPGVGLGLFISKAIVEAHGGRIWVDSKPGAGSSFSFTLPTAAVSDAARPEAPARALSPRQRQSTSSI
jgi:signal transduction histidine kinase